VVIVMLNLLIAIVSRVFDRCGQNYEEEFLRAKAELICQIEQGETCVACVFDARDARLSDHNLTRHSLPQRPNNQTGFFLNKEDPVWFPPRLYFISKLNARAGAAGRHAGMGAMSLGGSLAGCGAGDASSSFSAGCGFGGSFAGLGGGRGGCE
jgi:hypothetical protein